MGTHDHQDTRKGQRTGASAARGKGRRNRGDTGGDYQLTLATWLYMAAFSQAVIEQGGAVRYGLTRDGGALAIGMYVGEDYGTEYVRPQEDLAGALGEIAAVWIKDGASRFGEQCDRFSDDLLVMNSAAGKTPQKPT